MDFCKASARLLPSSSSIPFLPNLSSKIFQRCIHNHYEAFMDEADWISNPGDAEVDTDSGDTSFEMPFPGLTKNFRRRPTSKGSCGLPDELIEQILMHCSRRDLFSVAGTCRRLLGIANGIIYRHVDPVNPNRAIDLFLTVCLRNELGPIVRKCELSLTFMKNAPSSPLADPYFDRRVQRLGARAKFTHREILRDFGTLAAAALSRMHNLTHLELFFPNKEVQVDYVTRLQLQRCSFQLQTFHTNLRFDMALLAFLRRQTALRDLMFYTAAPLSALDMAAITPDCMPALSSLGWSNQVPMDLVLTLVSGRPIYTVNVHFSPLVSDISEFLEIGPRAEHIRTGNFTFRNVHHPDCSQLEAIYDRLPHLTGLGIAVVDLSPDILRNLKRAIGQFTELERLYIYDDTHAISPLMDNIMLHTKQFWQECPPLRKIAYYVCTPFVMADRTVNVKGNSTTTLRPLTTAVKPRTHKRGL